MSSGPAPRVVASVQSESWVGPVPSVAALVATYGRPHFLPGLLARLEDQDLSHKEFEVIVVDNGSTDDTWPRLVQLITCSPTRARAIRLDRNRGPGTGRNRGALEIRAPVIAITDDDCLPTPGWLRGIRDAIAAGADVVQGAVDPVPAEVDAMGPWDHTKRIRCPTPFFETCNVGYQRSAFLDAGGFDEEDPLLHPPSGRAFGEDACLAWAVQEHGGRAAWAPEALVHHRCIPSTFSRWLDDQRELAGFPGLVRRSPLIAEWLHHGIFLDRRSERFDLALLSIAVAAATRRRWPLLGVLPWLRMRIDAARIHSADPWQMTGLLGRYTISDTVAFVSMARGTVRHRRLVI